MKIEESEYKFAGTIKPANLTGKIKAQVVNILPISTKYGDKKVMVITTDDIKQLKDIEKPKEEHQIFLNAFSLANLVEAFGDETDSWKEREVTIAVENSKRTQSKDSIVVTAEKDEGVK